MSSLHRVQTLGLLLGWGGAALLFSATASAQSAFYTFTSGPGGDGFVWDHDSPPSGLMDLPDSDSLFAPDAESTGVNVFYNDSGNTTFFDSSYLAAGNSTVISGDAWWGNPSEIGFGYVGVDFVNTGVGAADSVAFDFAWAIAGEGVSPFLYVEVYDEEFDSAFLEFELTDQFDAGPAFGDVDGYEGSIFFDLNEVLLQDEGSGVDSIVGFNIEVGEVATFGGTGEFAIDNLSINGGPADGSNTFPSGFDGEEFVDGTTLVLNALVDSGQSTLGVHVTNDGVSDTTVSTQIEFGGDLDDLGQASGLSVPAGETVYAGNLVGLDTDTLSGTYGSDVTFSNDLNPSDPDSTLTFQVRVHDPPELSANNSGPVDVGGQPLTLDNAAPEPHAGAVRASVEVTVVEPAGPFTVDNLAVGDKVFAGEQAQAAATLDRYGLLSGLHTGAVTVGLEMKSHTGFFLSGAQPVDDVLWDVQATLADTASDSTSIGAGESFAKQVGVNHAETAATLIDGQSPAAQDLAMQYVVDPDGGASAVLVDDPVDVSFSGPGGLYVLQFTYDDGSLPGGLSESDLRLLFYDDTGGEFDLAVAGNSVGAGAFSLQSYDAYLASTGGGVLDAADLGAHGVDTAGNHAWAVLDHQAVIGLGVLGSVAIMSGDYNADGVVDAADYTVWRDNLGQSVTLPGDPTPGTVTAADYDVWRTNFGAGSAPPSAVAAPEPTAAGGVMMAAITCGWRSRRRR
ncbi:hypothetical protein KOR34_32940 [Posidoniimonas corsicana]|uniref:Dockerin domain-containing protein n=1 Tax=Posidoniimonas corsicana TaxID=1938618 RepID=A0A5C5V6V3_9BACT|nr:hypothetical protein [Posidoniimonas corsicana]TWT33462.1 hypothetical protein KOR34_32940 [Posidoniimonas corsicana]